MDVDETKTCVLILPIPPSVNNLYSYNPKTKLRFKSKRHPFFKLIDAYQFKNAGMIRKWHGAFKVDEKLSIERYFFFAQSDIFTKRGTIKKNDLSNRTKVIDDTVAEWLGIDDSQIFEEHAWKLTNTTSAEPHVRVHVSRLPA